MSTLDSSFEMPGSDPSLSAYGPAPRQLRGNRSLSTSWAKSMRIGGPASICAWGCNTPLELAIRNQTDRFSLAIDAIDRMPRFRVTGSSAREALLNQQIAYRGHAFEFGIDPPEITDWQWPF